MLHASTRTLIQRLCELTAEGAIGWRESEGMTAVFESEGFLIAIDKPPTCLRILNGEKREVERIDFEYLQGVAGLTPDGDLARDAALMARQADRIARGAEQAIARILSALSAPPARLLLDLPLVVDQSSAAPEFDTLHGEIRVSRVNTAESDAALAAVAADMALSREAAGIVVADISPMARNQPPLAAPEAFEALTHVEPLTADAAQSEAPGQDANQDSSPMLETLAEGEPSPVANLKADEAFEVTQPAEPTPPRKAQPSRVYRALRDGPVTPPPVRPMFGAIASFVQATTPPRPSSDMQPQSSETSGATTEPVAPHISSLRMLKVTAGGVVIPSSIAEARRTERSPYQQAQPATRSSPDPYKPWV